VSGRLPSILAVRLDSDGDVLLTGPAVRALTAGAARVSLLCGPRGAGAARLLPGVDEVLVHLAEWIDPEPPPLDRAGTLALVDRIAARRFDQAVVFTSFHQSPLPTALLLRLAGVPRVAAISEDYPGSLLDVRHRGLPDDLHEVERALSLAAALGHTLPPGDDGGLAVTRGHDVTGLVPDGPYVVVHPGTSVPARVWAPGRHAELVAALAARGWQVAVTGGPGETALTARVAGGRSGVTDLGGRTTLGQLAEVLARAEAVVVGNTGPAHLAAAVGTPVVSLFAPTVPLARWRPYRVPQRVLFRQVPCAGCRAKVCPVAGHPCLDGDGVRDGVGVADVTAALAALLGADRAPVIARA
jgi:ADP-heptose:LPS heptosyltransferase